MTQAPAVESRPALATLRGMKRPIRMMAVVTTFVLMLGALPATAESETVANVGWCWAVANFDDFTDELSYVFVRCWNGEDHTKSVLLGINSTTPYLMFFDEGREWKVPDDQGEVLVTYRFDDQPAVSVKATWIAQLERAELSISLSQAEEFMRALFSANRLIYRVGPEPAYIHGIELSGDRSALMDGAAEYVDELIERSRGAAAG